MIQTMSHSNEWAQFYHQLSFSGQPSQPVDIQTIPDPHHAAAAGSSPVDGSTSGSAGTLNAGGRVSKPKRRRSRASRRTPTTLLSTDTANFRAMVQQFTGGPGAHFIAPAGSGHAGPSVNFRAELGPAGMFHAHQQQQQQLLQHHASEWPVFGHAPDQAREGMPSLDPGDPAGHQFRTIRPPFMQ